MINKNTKLTAWDYFQQPLNDLIRHPDFSCRRYMRLLHARCQAAAMIESASRQGKI